MGKTSILTRKRLLTHFVIIISIFLIFELGLHSIFLYSQRKTTFMSFENFKKVLNIEYDMTLGWKLKPYAEGKLDYTNHLYKLNFMGLRGKDFDIEKKDGVYRIICLGGSSTFGVGLDETDTYPYKLENLLSRDTGYRRFEIINAGVLAYNLTQINIFLAEKLLKYRPDMIIVISCINNIFPSDYSRYYVSGKKKRISQFLNYFLHKSMTYRLIEVGILKLRYENKLPKNIFTNIAISSRVEDYGYNIKSLNEICQQNGIELLLCTQPCLEEGIGEVLYGEFILFTQKLLRVAKSLDIIIIDLNDKFPYRDRKKYFNDSKLDPHQHFIHPNGMGNEIIAEEIDKVLIHRFNIDKKL